MKLEGGEINDFRDRMGACSLMRNLSRPPDSAWTRLRPWIAGHCQHRTRILAYGLSLSFCMQGLFSSTGPGAGLKGGTAPDLAVHSHPLSYSGQLGAPSEPHSRNSNLSRSQLLVSLQSSDLRRFYTSPGSQSMVSMTDDYLVGISRPFAHP